MILLIYVSAPKVILPNNVLFDKLIIIIILTKINICLIKSLIKKEIVIL